MVECLRQATNKYAHPLGFGLIIYFCLLMVPSTFLLVFLFFLIFVSPLCVYLSSILLFGAHFKRYEGPFIRALRDVGDTTDIRNIRGMRNSDRNNDRFVFFYYPSATSSASAPAVRA